ncbi:mini-chromosome maintenance complex-binding protein [Chrysoperla carnea]|uniref:mini-chromosome maintenance complex-binding protein n=1 Tax=Chrysoperla carnea TaxID=189513 RepID=UPI001D05DE6C|nr:mini-chromosome maintenance complex-binding protein [Chrysoperla carnea]
MPILQITIDELLTNKEQTLQQIEKAWDEIPLMNDIGLDSLKNGSLVRFRGMVQDMHSPEYYLDMYEIKNTITNEKTMRNGKYKDIIDVHDNEVFTFESDTNVNKERQTFVVISMPGLNSWTRNLENESKKLQLCTSSNQTKRKIEDEVEEMETSDSSSSVTSKKICENTTESSSESQNLKNISPEFLLNCPLADRPGKACLVKVYEDYDWIKINEMIETVGFLAVSPLPTNPTTSDDGTVDMENQVMNPPPSLIPRIHSIVIKRITHDNPLLPTKLESYNDSLNPFRDVFKDLHLVLTQLLLGDKLAAEFLICHLISRVYLRKDVISLGQCTINFSNIPSEKYENYVKNIYEILELMVPKSHYFPMTLDNMNSLEFTPKKDYDCNRLTTGLLQLSAHTHLIIDESRLQAGRLDQIGVKNVQALANVVRNQRLPYDFKFYQMDYDTDIPVLIFSEGKSLLPCDFHVPLEPDSECVKTLNEIIEASKHFLNSNLLDRIRKFLTIARHSNCELTDDIQEVIQEDFVEMRKKDQKINSEDLHKLLVLSRLIALSEGQCKVGVDAWKRAQVLETERKSRLK